MRRRSIRLALFGIITAVLAVCAVQYGAAGSARAQEAPVGITVAPARLKLVLHGGDQVQESTVVVKNTYAERVSFSVSVHGVEQGADGALVPDMRRGAVAGVFQDVLTVTPNVFSLDPGQSINVKVRLVDSQQLSPGGQYAALVVSQQPGAGGNVALTPAVAVSVFIIKEQGAVRMLSASVAGVGSSLFRAPNAADIVFKNEGNVPLTPRAAVKLYDPAGGLVAQGVGNEESLTVMSGKELKVRVAMHAVGNSWRPGTYRLQVQYRHDDTDQTEEKTVPFVVVPPRLVAVGGGLVVVACLLGWSAVRWLIPNVRKRIAGRERGRTDRPQQSIDRLVVRRAPRSVDGIMRKPPKQSE